MLEVEGYVLPRKYAQYLCRIGVCRDIFRFLKERPAKLTPPYLYANIRELSFDEEIYAGGYRKVVIDEEGNIRPDAFSWKVAEDTGDQTKENWNGNSESSSTNTVVKAGYRTTLRAFAISTACSASLRA